MLAGAQYCHFTGRRPMLRFLKGFRAFNKQTSQRLKQTQRLELHVTHACNLGCESCSHYSNHGHKGHLDPALADRWMAPWSKRIALSEFVLLGGEPTIHPALAEFVPLARRHWPAALLRIVTNGFFLDRHPDLPHALSAAGNAEIALSVHHDDPDYRARVAPALDQLERWQRDFGIKVRIWQSHSAWTRRYHGFGATMAPFEDGQPRRSWEICPARHAKQLHDGMIWKCAPTAYLGMQNARYGLSERWQPYLGYQPLAPTCGDAELDAYFAREDEPVCGMCPAERHEFALPLPLPGRAAGAAAQDGSGDPQC